MGSVVKYLLVLMALVIVGAGYAPQARAQFWKKKKYHTKRATSKASRPDKSEYRDAFSRKSGKGPNVRTSKKPFWKSKKRMHQHSISRKTKKPGSKKFFKPKYSSVKLKKRSGDSFSRNARKTRRDSKKGGGQGNGVFRGRKK